MFFTNTLRLQAWGPFSESSHPQPEDEYSKYDCEEEKMKEEELAKKFFRLGFFAGHKGVAHFVCDFLTCWPGEVVFYNHVLEALRFALNGQASQAAAISFEELFRRSLPPKEYERAIFLDITSRVWGEYPELLKAVEGPLPKFAAEYDR